jgi:pSer/pThr/pTyr-binding forkhead associated (FHA) protein
VKQGVLVLGRASTSDLRLQHPSISRRHAQLTRQGDRLSLKDLGSQNGTYVNRDRLTSEVELHPGDEIALGNALLRLRGPGPTPEPRVSFSRPTSSLRVGMSSRRLVLLATATGSLVAVFLTLALVRLTRSRTEPDPVETVQSPRVELVTAFPEEGEENAPAPKPAVLTPSSPVEKTRGASGKRALSAQAIAESGKVQAQKASGLKPREAVLQARGEAGSGKATVKSALAPATEPVPEGEAEAEVLARYEAGNVDSALALARSAHLERLASTLARFQEEWSAGTTALAARDSASAIPHLSTALELDQQLAKGWGSFAPRIRKALTQAQRQAGARPASEP